MSDQVGFKPARKCPLCHEPHNVEYQYRGVDMLVCPKMKGDKMMLITEDYADASLSYLKEILRFSANDIPAIIKP